MAICRKNSPREEIHAANAAANVINVRDVNPPRIARPAPTAILQFVKMVPQNREMLTWRLPIVIRQSIKERAKRQVKTEK